MTSLSIQIILGRYQKCLTSSLIGKNPSFEYLLPLKPGEGGGGSPGLSKQKLIFGVLSCGLQLKILLSKKSLGLSTERNQFR